MQWGGGIGSSLGCHPIQLSVLRDNFEMILENIPLQHLLKKTVLQIRGYRDNKPYFSIKTYFVTIIGTVSSRRF